MLIKMSRSYLSLTLLICLIVSSVPCFAQTDQPAGVDGRPAIMEKEAVSVLVAAARIEKRFLEKDEAILLYQGDDYSQNSDGSCSYRSHSLILCRTATVPVSLREVKIPYNTRTQDIVIHNCRIHQNDGEITDHTGKIEYVSPHNLSDQADPAVPMEKTDREAVCLIPFQTLAPGSVLELDIEVIDKAGRLPWLEGTVFWRGQYPMLIHLVAVTYPSHLHLNHLSRNKQVSPQISRSGGSTTYIWQANDLKPVKSQELQTNRGNSRQSLIFSTCPSWDFLETRLRELYLPVVATDSLINVWADQAMLKDSARSRLEQVAAVLDLSSCGISGPVNQPLVWDLPTESISRLLTTRRGSQWERLALSTALLNRAGIWSQIVLCSGDQIPEMSVPGLQRFDRLLISSRAWPDSLMLDPIEGRILSRSLDWSNRPLWRVGSRQSQWLYYPTEKSVADIEIAINLDQNGAVKSGTAEILLSGGLYAYDELSDPSTFAAFYLQKLVPGASLNTVSVTALNPNNCRLQFTFAASEIGRVANRRRYLYLSGGPVSLPDLIGKYQINLPGRQTPLILGSTFHERVSWRISIPDPLTSVFLPSPAALRTQVGEFRLERSRFPLVGAERGGTMIELSWRFELLMAEIPPSRINELRELLRAYQAQSQRLLIFENQEQ